MSLRDLVVSIDFDDININNLLNVDDAMNQIESSFGQLGGDIDDAARNFNQLSSSAGGALNEITGEAAGAGNALNEIGNDASQTAGDITSAMNTAEGSINDISQAGDQASNALDEVGQAGNDLGQEVNQGANNASGALNEIQSEAGQAENALDQLGDAGQQAGNDAANGADEAADAADEAGGAAENSAKSFGAWGTVGAKAGALIGATFTAAYGAVVLTVQETESAFDRLQAKTATTGAEFEGLKTVATDVFTNAFGESIGQVTDDVAVLQSMFGDLNNEQLTALAEGAYTIGDLWGPEVKEVGKTVSTMTKTFDGLSESKAMDLMTTAFQKTGDYSDDLLDTFNEYSVYFQKMGFDAEGFTNILVKGAELGAFTMDKAGDAIKELGIRSIDASEATADGFKAIGLDAELMTKNYAAGGDTAQQAFAATVAGLASVEDPIKQNAAGVALFGTQWEDLRETVILGMSDGVDALGDFEGATQKAADTAYDNFGSKMTGIFRELKIGVAEAFMDNGGEEMLLGIASKTEDLVPKIEDLVEKGVAFAETVQDNWPAIKETIIGISTAVGSFALIMGGLKIVGVITTLFKAWRAGTIAQTLATYGLNTALWLNPMTWIVAGIAAAIAIGVLLYRNWDTVKEKAGELWSKIIELKDGAVALLTDKFGDLMEKGTELKDKFLELKDQGVAVLQTKFQEFKDKVGEIKDAAVELKDKFVELKDQGIQVLQDKMDEFKGKLEEHQTAITVTASVITAVFLPALVRVAIQAGVTAAVVTATFIVSLVRTATQAVITAATVTVSFIGSMIATATQAVITGATVTASFIGSMIRTAAQAIITGATVTISFIGSMIASAAQAVVTGATLTISFIGAMIRMAAQAVVTGAALTISLIGAMIRMSAQAVLTAATMTISMIGSLIRFAAQGWITTASLVATTGAMIVQRGAMIAGAVVTGTITAAQWALNAAMMANPIGLVIALIVGLVAIGVLLYKNWDTIKAGAVNLWNTIKEKFAGIKTAISNAIQPVIGWFDSLKEKWDNFKSSLSGFKMPKWMSTIGGAIGGAASKLGGLINGSHATGLASVPFDGYRAELHKGEAVLTASQADALRRTGILDNVGTKPKLDVGGPQVTNKIDLPDDDKPKGDFDPNDYDGPNPIAGGSGGATTNVNTFAPQITIQVEGGKDGKVDHAAVAQAVKKEMEKFWIQMNLQNA